MLKPVDQAEPPREERPVGDLVHQLVEEGKAYARAEIGLAKAIAAAKAKALALPAALSALRSSSRWRRLPRSPSGSCSRLRSFSDRCSPASPVS